MNVRRHNVAVVVTLAALLNSLLIVPYARFSPAVCHPSPNLFTFAAIIGMVLGFAAFCLAAVDARESDRRSMYAASIASLLIILILGALLGPGCY